MPDATIRAADTSYRDFSGKAVKSACYAPFVSMFLTTAGDVQACCRNESFLLGNVTTRHLSEIWNGGKINVLRRSLAEYNFGPGCEYCEWEAKGGNSQTAFRTLFDPFPVLSEQPRWPAVIDFVGSNICNFECVMCWGELSSSIRANRQGLPPLPRVYDDRFFADLRHFLPHLRWMNFLGGEPFLSPESHRIWQMMVEDQLSIPCHVTTNGSQYNARVERVLSTLPLNLTISLDGITKETFESIRRRSNFETVIANLHRFRAYAQQRGTSFKLAFCLMRQNWREFGELLLFGDELDCDVLINTVIDPSHCSLFTLPPYELRLIVASMEKQDALLKNQLRRNRKAWDESLQSLRAALETTQIRRFEGVLNSQSERDNPLAAARKLAEAGDHEGAIRKLNEIGERHADYYFALALSGDLRSMTGDSAGAERDLETARRVSEKLPHVYFSLARVRFRQGRVGEALENALKAKQLIISEEPLETLILGLLAVIQVRRWRVLQAYQLLARLIQLPPSAREGQVRPDAQEGLRRILSDLGNNGAGVRPRSLSERVWALFYLAQLLTTRTRLNVLPDGRATAGSALGETAETHGMVAKNLVQLGGRQAGEWRRSGWSLRVAGANRARLEYPMADTETIRIAIERAQAPSGHEIQLNHPLMGLASNRRYGVRFQVRADAARTVGFGLARSVPPWTNLGLYRALEVNAIWQEVQEEFVPASDELNGRLHLDLGDSGVSVEVRSLAISDLGPVETASDGVS